MTDGVLFIDKPKNLTSRDVVNQISKIYHTKKVGHTGTLDPMATGILIVCLGKYTKLVESLTSTTKEYLAKMVLGIETDTGDITGKIEKKVKKEISIEKIKETFLNFPQIYEQEVPLYSAVKINGKKLYEYAREGIKVKLPKRKVEIFFLELKNYENNEITFQTTVSKGTYIRSLVRDLAFQMGTVGTMSSLRRIKQGSIDIKDCLPLEQITKDTPLKTMKDLFSYPTYEVTEREKEKIKNGNFLFLSSKEEKLMLTYQGEVLAIYKKNQDRYDMEFKVI